MKLRVSLFLLSLSACSSTSIYDRGRLRHPTMKMELRSRALIHLESLTEGAIGGIGELETGCGCN